MRSSFQIFEHPASDYCVTGGILAILRIRSLGANMYGYVFLLLKCNFYQSLGCCFMGLGAKNDEVPRGGAADMAFVSQQHARLALRPCL
ncbi:protein of unknown function [Magnetospirillum gryphiswaldense MSR-1 v2]|uniref:Uncharacterized protein n=1 Tax=Magnetospirillum gryphiswaldense (strain DSM 6361 / JCM 21280 / NBRC 15271 / MSR-1) TaxID=431944 RepID=V6EX23_MAGGM|nr:protein of unknown function [Magnetospirillum gryphiswaldense MSR-1 v2]